MTKRCCMKFSRDWKYFKCPLRNLNTEITGFAVRSCSEPQGCYPIIWLHHFHHQGLVTTLPLLHYPLVWGLPSSSWTFPKSFRSFQHGNPFLSGKPSPENSPCIGFQHCLLCLIRATRSRPSESPVSMSTGWKVPISGHPTTLSSPLCSAHLIEIIICS